MSQEYTIDSLDKLAEVAHTVAASLTGGEILLLSGELGAGKTTFTQALARQLGVTESVTSPTFTIAGEYPVSTHATIKRFLHLDLYRLPASATQDHLDSVVAEILAQSGEADTVAVIEWPEKLGDSVPAHGRWIYFKHGDKPTQRVVRVEEWPNH